MTVAPWITIIGLRGHLPLWCIEDFDHFIRRWERALRRGEFFELRHAGRTLWLNPAAIMYAERHVERSGVLA